MYTSVLSSVSIDAFLFTFTDLKKTCINVRVLITIEYCIS